MSQKEFTNVIPALVVVIIVSAVGYFVFLRKAAPTAQQTLAPTPTQAPATQQPTPATQTPSGEITNWKTYRNEKSGFEIKYPANWFNQECDFRNVGFSPDSIKFPKCGTEGFYPLSLVIYPYATKQEAENSFSRVSDVISSSRNNVSKTEVKFAGASAIKITGVETRGELTELGYNPLAGTRTTVILFLHGTDFYQIYYYGEFYKISSEEIFNHILSTFKFLN